MSVLKCLFPGSIVSNIGGKLGNLCLRLNLSGVVFDASCACVLLLKASTCPL